MWVFNRERGEEEKVREPTMDSWCVEFGMFECRRRNAERGKGCRADETVGQVGRSTVVDALKAKGSDLVLNYLSDRQPVERMKGGGGGGGGGGG